MYLHIYYKKMLGLAATLERFPEVELSYDKTLDKKVRADAFSILPKGDAAIIWITFVHHNRVALLMKLHKNGEISSATPMVLSFHNDLSLGNGTLMHGIVFTCSNMTNFACTDILLHSGLKVNHLNMIDKMELVCNILDSQIDTRVLTRDGLSIGLPITTSSFLEAIDIAKSLPYKVSHIRSLIMRHSHALGLTPYTASSKTTAVLIVRPALQNDIYYLYSSDGKKHRMPAAIQDYDTSVLLNRAFRTIKENDNLDTLEESDDEIDFQDVRPDKYVDLNKSFAYVCEYIPRFGKWQPIQRADRSNKLTSSRELAELERKNTR